MNGSAILLLWVIHHYTCRRYVKNVTKTIVKLRKIIIYEITQDLLKSRIDFLESFLSYYAFANRSFQLYKYIWSLNAIDYNILSYFDVDKQL